MNEPDVRKPALTIFTSRDIQKGEEITFAYFGEGDDDEEMSDEELEDKTVKVVCAQIFYLGIVKAYDIIIFFCNFAGCWPFST